MTGKKVIVFTFPNCLGGVSSFNRNIINFSDKHPDFLVRVVLLTDEQDTRQKFSDEILADEVIIFRFSYWENNRNVYKRLSALLGNEQGCIVTDNWLTLNVVKQLGSPKAIVILLHDLYYVNLAIEFKRLIDLGIAHSSFFKDVLLATDIDSFQDKIDYIPYGVQLPANNSSKPGTEKHLRLVFLGRWVESKGVLLLKEIDRLISDHQIKVNWTILGTGPLENKVKGQWLNSDNVHFATAESTDEVYNILESQDILVFPSKFEGTPVAVMEAMSRGVVPVVTDLPGGTRDMVSDETGFRCQSGRVEEFADAIVQLDRNRQQLAAMQDACLTRARQRYDIKAAANNYFHRFYQKSIPSAAHPALKRWNLSKLDSPILPTGLVYRIRKFKNSLKGKPE